MKYAMLVSTVLLVLASCGQQRQSNGESSSAVTGAVTTRGNFSVGSWQLNSTGSTSFNRTLPVGSHLRFSSSGDAGSEATYEVRDSSGVRCDGQVIPNYDALCHLSNSKPTAYTIRVTSVGTKTSRGRVDGWN